MEEPPGLKGGFCSPSPVWRRKPLLDCGSENKHSLGGCNFGISAHILVCVSHTDVCMECLHSALPSLCLTRIFYTFFYTTWCFGGWGGVCFGLLIGLICFLSFGFGFIKESGTQSMCLSHGCCNTEPTAQR